MTVEPWPAGTPLLHVFGSDHPHGEVFIAGTEAALKELHAAIGRALAGDPRAVTSGVMVRDGEGFWCFVVRASEAEMEDVPLPYHGEIFGDAGEPMPPWLTARCEAAAQAAMRRARETQETKPGTP